MKLKSVIATVLVAGVAFLGGYGYQRWYAKKPAPQTPGGRRILYWVDPMHPGYKSDKPGIAPDCGMKLEPVYADDPSSMPMGTIRVSPEKQQLIGVQYGEVESSAGAHTFRAVGRVAFDETKIARVHARIDGWVEKVFVDFVGKVVDKGQPLLTIYSPELVASQQEYLLALKSQRIMKNSALDAAIADSHSLVAAARKRLELWELSEEQIEEVTRTGKPMTYVTLYSPIRGYVVARNAFPKQRIMPDTELYTVVDLDRVWIMADVFEYEAPLVRMGQPARVSLSYYPGKSFSARVNYIQPQVDPMARTLKVRLEAGNPGLLLKPDMYVDVEFRVDLPRRVSVPAQAVLDSGLRKTVFVDRGNGYLEPRQVETGERIGDRIEIRKGLEPGERIVTSGNFLIDSESRLKSALEGMQGMPGMPGHQHGATPAPEAPSAGAPESMEMPAGEAPSGHAGHSM